MAAAQRAAADIRCKRLVEEVDGGPPKAFADGRAASDGLPLSIGEVAVGLPLALLKNGLIEPHAGARLNGRVLHEVLPGATGQKFNTRDAPFDVKLQQNIAL